MSRPRHSRFRPWWHIALCAAAVLLAGDATIHVSIWAYRAAATGLYVAALALGLATLLLVVTAVSWVASTSWYAGRDRFLNAAAVRYAPPKRPLAESADEHQDELPAAAADAPDPEVTRRDAQDADHWSNGVTLTAAEPRVWMPPPVFVNATDRETATAAAP